MPLETNPVVSVCVPIYNSEAYLVRFLESAVTQTQENIEIICVDNHSTDASEEIITSFCEAFPNKVFYYQTDRHYPSAGAGRNVAIHHARGKYIFLCDSDDIIPPNALQQLYSVAESTESDMVCGWAYLANEEANGQIYIKPLSRKKTESVSNDIAIQSGCEFWMRLIKKDLIDSVGTIPQEFVFDDVAYLPILHSYAEKITFVDSPVYFYFRRTDSACGSPRYDVCVTSVLAEQYALEHCNAEHKKAVEKLVADRTNGNINIRWQFFGLFAEWSKQQMDWIPDNELILQDKALYNKIRWAAQLASGKIIPSRVVISNFARNLSENRINEVTEGIFYNESQVVILDEHSCNLNANAYVKEAYDRGNLDCVAGYFALKEIYEHGGIFVHDVIKILNYFSYYTYQNAFFTLIDKDTYSDKIFGAPAGCEVYADLLKTYSEKWDKNKKYPSLAERIKTILTAKYNIPLDGKGRLFQPEISIIPPELCVVDTRFGSTTKRVICEHDFSEHAGEEDYVTLKRSTLELLLSGQSAAMYSGGASPAEKELAKLKQSNVYKFVLLWKKIGDGPWGPTLKKIFHKLMAIKNKLKRK